MSDAGQAGSGRQVGRTRDAGWEIGVSATLDHPVERVWALVADPEGQALWLGPGADLPRDKGAAYATDDGTVGEVRSFRDGDRVRVTMRPAGWDHDTTVQVAVSRVGPDRTRLGLHQEWLADSDERERQREHWKAVLANLRSALDG